MSDETEKKTKAIRKVRRMLREIHSLAEHASLSGAFEKEGALEAVRAYNLLLTHLGEQEVDLGGMFQPLPEAASFDRIGVASRLLRGYLEDEEDEGSSGKSVKIVVGKHGEHAGHINLEELGKLKDIGAVIREHLPDFLRTPPTPPVPPTPPTPPTAPTPPAPPDDRDAA